MIVDTREDLRQKIYQVIIEKCYIKKNDFVPNTIINMGKNSVDNIYAEDLILCSANIIGLSQNYAANQFPYKTYFDSDVSPFLIPIVFILFILHMVKLIYQQIKNSILFLLKRPIIKYETNSKKTLTAQQFADIMISILDKYQEE